MLVSLTFVKVPRRNGQPKPESWRLHLAGIEVRWNSEPCHALTGGVLVDGLIVRMTIVPKVVSAVVDGADTDLLSKGSPPDTVGVQRPEAWSVNHLPLDRSALSRHNV